MFSLIKAIPTILAMVFYPVGWIAGVVFAGLRAGFIRGWSL